MMNTFLEEVYKLKDIIRYNTRIKITQESVAEHSFFVAVITLHLCNKYNLDEKTTSTCVIKALLHDMPEMEINDITHDVKEKLNLRPLLKKYEDNYYKKYYPKYSKMLCNDDENLVNTIVELADVLSVIQFCNREKTLGNTSKQIKEIVNNSEDRISVLYSKLKELTNHE